MVILTDKSLMPFGKHKGTELANVPGKYLFWLYEQPSFDRASPLGTYIITNWDAIQKEINNR